MGMEQTVTFTGRTVPAWTDVRDFLVRLGFPAELRMIDGELSSPDETPPDSWHELRVGTPQGMVTLRREQERVRFVIWANADTALREAWNALIWAFARIGDGRIIGFHRAATAADFQQIAELPAALRAIQDEAGGDSSSC